MVCSVARTVHIEADIDRVDDPRNVAEQAQQNVDVNKFDEHGYTPLHLACDRGNAAVVELLLSKGADHSLKDPDELTALELATIAGHDDIVALIQED